MNWALEQFECGQWLVVSRWPGKATALRANELFKE